MNETTHDDADQLAEHVHIEHTFDDGGQAFPDPAPCDDGAQGMTLLDYFAGKALAGILASPAYVEAMLEYARQARGGKVAGEILSNACYDYAAAMIAEKRRREARPAAKAEDAGENLLVDFVAATFMGKESVAEDWLMKNRGMPYGDARSIIRQAKIRVPTN